MDSVCVCVCVRGCVRVCVGGEVLGLIDRVMIDFIHV